MVTCMCYLVTFEHVCSAFTLVRRHGKPTDRRQLFVNSAIFNTLDRLPEEYKCQLHICSDTAGSAKTTYMYHHPLKLILSLQYKSQAS